MPSNSVLNPNWMEWDWYLFRDYLLGRIAEANWAIS